jgi:alpha-glucosidase (family GH31 glycosyl hydrolase)
LERYGIVRTDWPPVQTSTHSSDNELTIRTAEAELTISRKSGTISLSDVRGRVLCPKLTPLLRGRFATGDPLRNRVEGLIGQFQAQENPAQLVEGAKLPDNTPFTPVIQPSEGFGLLAQLRPQERFYGLGTASKEHIQLRGQSYFNWVRYKNSEQPIPFVMSSNGWGIFLNTTWRHYVDLGKSDPDEMLVWGPKGDLDFFLIAGADYCAMLDRYTQITGRPILLPQWAYGLTWINFINSNQWQVLDNALRFRDAKIPCDGFGLEPGWNKYYDDTPRAAWNTDRFYMPNWMRGKKWKDETFIGALNRNGFKLHLWLRCNYDLTGEAERQYALRMGNTPSQAGEPWFRHLESFVDDGVSAWKVDPAHFVDKADPERVYANGRSEFEMHNLNSVLVAKQMYEGFRDYTGLRPMMQHCGGWSGTQHWMAQTVGDIIAGPEGLVWMLNTGMSGCMNTTGDMYLHKPIGETRFWPDGAGIHFAFLAPWTQMDGWAFPDQPWFAGEKLDQMIHYYATLRYRLMPYLYSTAHVGARTGMPILRPMPLMFPDDLALADATQQYMLGDSLLVTAFTPRVRFPEGRWIDAWAGKQFHGPQEIEYAIPEGRGGGLFIRAGAILPHWPQMEYVGQAPVPTLDLHIYPEDESNFILYEDDGLTMDYEKNGVAQTKIECRAAGDSVTVQIAPRTGSYNSMPDQRSFNVFIHGARPREVRRDGAVVPQSAQGWQFDAGAGATRVTVTEDPQRKTARTIHLLGALRKGA